MKKLLMLLALCCAPMSCVRALAQAAAPVISPVAGSYASTQSVTVTDATSGADIFCTTDGSTPTPESTKYTGAITISATQTVKCIAAVAGIRRTNIQNDDPNASGTYWKAADYINGGGSGVPTGLVHSSGHATPSLSGASMEFSMTAHGSQTNVLWAPGTGFGQCDTCTYEVFDYQLYLDTGVCSNNGTTEQDNFKIASSLGNLRYMGGGQWRRTGGCTSGHACLDLGGNSNVHWTFTGVDIPLACGVWHHMVRTEHFVPSEVTSKPCTDFNGAHWPYFYQDSWSVDGTKYDNSGAGWKFCANSVNWPSWNAPQFQEDATTGTHTMYLDQANFTSYFPGSSVTSNAYTITGGTGVPTAATPTISPAGGFYTSSQTVTMADSTAGSTIHYTTNGSTPTISSTTYTTAITVSTTTTVKAIATATGFINSPVTSGVYTFTGSGGLTAAPTFSPTAGSYAAAQFVILSDTTSGAVIYYTTDGTLPTTSSNVYSVPLNITATATLKAMAVAPGLTNSSVATATFTIGGTLTAATPTFSPLAGNYAGTQTVTISDSSPSPTIYYTTDGSTPTTGSTVYSAPLSVSSTTTVKAIATSSGLSTSAVGTALYTIGCGLTGLVTGNVDYSQLKAGSRRGAGTLVQMALGGFTANDLLYYDCNGNAIDSGLLFSSVATKSAVQQESYIYAADTGTANAYAITLSPVPTIVAGSIATLKVGHTNTGASTLAVNGGSATAIKKGDGTVALAASDWTAGQIVTVKYDGTNWQWGGGSSGGSGTPGGSSGQIQYNNAGAFGGFTATGDCTITPSTGAVVCTKTNGVSYAASATTDTTSAANITSGSLPAARLPNTAVTPGTYNNVTATVDAAGRITAMSTGSVTGVAPDAGIATAGNGQNTITLGSTPLASSVTVHLNGVALPSTTLTVSGATVTYSGAWTAGDVIAADWITAGSAAGTITLSSTTNFIRGTAYTSGASTLAFPAGSAVGDTAVLFITSTSASQTIPSGWTSLFNPSQSFYGGAIATKTLTSGDISTGSVTLAASQPAGMVVLDGTQTITETKGQNFSLTSPLTLTTTASAAANNTALYFVAQNTNATPTVNRGTLAGSGNNGSQGGALYKELLSGSGTVSAIYTTGTTQASALLVLVATTVTAGTYPQVAQSQIVGLPAALAATLTNPMTAKGDLIGGGTSGTPTRLAVGADTNVLTADSTQATGLKWAAAAGGSGAYVGPIEAHTASSSAELDFTTCISATYDHYVIDLENVLPATNGVQLQMQVSTNGGTSYDTTSGHYEWAGTFSVSGAAQAPQGSTSATNISILPSTQNTGAGESGTLNLYNPANASTGKLLMGMTAASATSNANQLTIVTTAGRYTQSTAYNAFRFLFSSGNIASGTVRCYGISH